MEKDSLGGIMDTGYCLSGFFPITEEHHHFLGQADIIALIRDFVPFYPLCHGEFFMVNGQGIIAIYVTEKSKKQGTAEGPGLALVVAEIFDLQSHFLHYFSVNSLLNCFSDFCKACNESVAFESDVLHIWTG